MRKTGFTIAEFLVCIMITFVIMGSAVTIPLKKNKSTKNFSVRGETRICDCSNEDGFCEFEIDSENGRFEFFTIHLLGGGAAASAEIGGASGSLKTVYYPMLDGKYRIYLGQGGVSGGNINGGDTLLYKVNDNNTYELIEFAAGGAGSNEKIYPELLYTEDGQTEEQVREELAKGVELPFGGQTTCGKGGDAKDGFRDGIRGAAIIKW